MYKYFFNMFSVFMLPFLAFYNPLQHSLIALGILVLINYILAVIAEFKERKGSVFGRVVFALISKNSLFRTIGVIFDYIIALTLISLFEVYFLNVNIADVSTKLLSLSHLAIIYMASKEVKRGFKINELITGSNFYVEIEDFLPERVKNLFETKKN